MTDPPAGLAGQRAIGVDEAEELARRYARALDRLDGDLLASCFHRDAKIDMGAVFNGGPDGFVAAAMEFMGQMKLTRHLVSNTLLVGQDWETYVDAWHLIEHNGEARELMVRGRYLQRHALEDGRWQLSRHSEIVDYGEERTSDRSWFDAGSGMPEGRRDRQDRSYTD